jgi:hypothetical protein
LEEALFMSGGGVIHVRRRRYSCQEEAIFITGGGLIHVRRRRYSCQEEVYSCQEEAILNGGIIKL